MPAATSRAPMRRRALIAAAATVVLLEVASFGALKAMDAYPDRSFLDMYRHSACMKANDFNYGQHARSPEEIGVMLRKIPHPFFGFTELPTWPFESEADKVGAEYANSLRYRVQLGDDPRGDDTFTIGVLGASVAASLGSYLHRSRDFGERLREGIPHLRDREIVVRNMAIGSSRQPAQFAVATTYMELLDMTINLDGWSEIAVVQHPEYPIEHPMFSDVFYSGVEPSAYLKMRAGEEVCRWTSVVPKWIRPLAYSNFYYLFWHSAAKRINRTLYVREPPAPSVPDEFTTDEQRELYAHYFQKYTRYQHQLLSSNGVRAYFFLQPNQHVADSQEFSAEEKRTALNNSDFNELTRRFALLREKVAELREEGVPAFDLTMIYKDVLATVYIDSCCHVNKLGNRIMAERIADLIVARERGLTARQ